MKLLNKLNEPTFRRHITIEYYPYRSYLFGIIAFTIHLTMLYFTQNLTIIISFFSGIYYVILWSFVSNRQIKRIKEPINKNNMETIEQ